MTPPAPSAIAGDRGPRAPYRRLWWGSVLLLLAAVGVKIAVQRGARSESAAAPQAAMDRGATGRAPSGPAPWMAGQSVAVSTDRAEDGAAQAARHQLAVARLERAEQTLREYERATRYPFDSRPIAEHPDQVYPTRPVGRGLPLIAKGSSAPSQDVTLKLQQDRVQVVAGESIRLEVSCEDSLHARLPCQVETAMARGLAHAVPAGSTVPGPIPVAFNDRGQDSDVRADDGVSTAGWVPGAAGFARYSGPISVEIHVRSGGEVGDATFDLLYTPSAPARFTGRVREAVEAGSLALYLGIEVVRPGRYVINARVDDADGKPFAYLQWNDPLTQASRQVRLQLFGALLRDGRPKLPLRLRDAQGFLLKEDTDPDRETMASLTGDFYRTGTYSLAEFSDADWQSEERERHLKEFRKDVADARAEVEGK